MATTTRRINPGTLSPQIELFGDWGRTRILLSGIDRVIAEGSRLGRLSAARKLKRIVRRNIRENGGRIGWPPVSEGYAKKKSQSGYDPNNLYVMTGLYYRSIDIWGKGDTHYVGLRRNTKHTRDGARLTLVQIVTILEHGSEVRNIKARPLWTPSFKQFGGTKRVKSIVLWHIRDQIYKNYRIRAKVTL